VTAQAKTAERADRPPNMASDIASDVASGMACCRRGTAAVAWPSS
jgi:hypothetical protein